MKFVNTESYKKQLETLLEETNNQLNELQSINPAQSTERATENDIEEDYEESELGFRVNERSEVLTEKKQLIVEALQRIENGTYGICLGSGEKIAEERLEAIPYTRYTLEYQEKMDQQKEAIQASSK